MAVESKRGCGYRKVGGLYFIGGEIMAPCDRLPFELKVCPCCGEGYPQFMGYKWIQPTKVLGGAHVTETGSCSCTKADPQKAGWFCDCPICDPFLHFGKDGKAGLMWVGEGYYKTPADFLKEGASMGISKRINNIPRGFKIGKTWIFLAHPKAGTKIEKTMQRTNGNPDQKKLFVEEPVYFKGIFSAFRPTKIERIVKQSEWELWDFIVGYLKHHKNLDNWNGQAPHAQETINAYNKLQRDVDRGITLVPVPDDDKDHQ